MLVRRYATDPFAELRSLQQEMNRVFNGYTAGPIDDFPTVNIWSNANEVIVTAELPGLELEDINIMVKNNHLTLEGERKPHKVEEGVKCHRCERGAGHFLRSFTLPYEAEVDKVSATYRNGILTIKLPRAEHSKPKQIKISVD